MKQVTMFDAGLDAKFADFHAKNPKVYTELVELAMQAHRKGRRKIGIGMLFEVLRWNRFITTTDPDFKLNNNYRSRYARMIMHDYPELNGLFDLRELRS